MTNDNEIYLSNSDKPRQDVGNTDPTCMPQRYQHSVSVQKANLQVASIAIKTWIGLMPSMK